MDKINVFFKINGKVYCDNVPCNLSIDKLYDIIENKIATKIRKTHAIKIHGKIADEKNMLSDYNVTSECTLDVYYSMSKAGLYHKPDVEGISMFQKLISNIAHDSGLFDINIISLMSYNVDLSIAKKVFLQQLQWPILNKELSRLDKIYDKLEGLINVNIILPDRNFIGYNSRYNPSFETTKKIFKSITRGSLITDIEIDSLVKIINENSDTDKNPQINSLCGIKLNSAFNKNASEYNYRISKHSVMLQNFKLKKLLSVSEQLEKIIQLNFYYVGVIFTNTDFDEPKDSITYGIDFSQLKPYNLHVHMWTGEKII
jgi:hypothetical protein